MFLRFEYIWKSICLNLYLIDVVLLFIEIANIMNFNNKNLSSLII